MEKIIYGLSLKPTAARPMGYLRFSLFFLAFLIARIPLWFIILCAFLINNTIGITYTVFISFAVILCRIFIESEIAGGKNSFKYFFLLHLLRGVGAFLFYFIIFSIIIYIAAPHNDVIGKISMAAVILLLYMFMYSDNKNTYYNGYYVPFKISIVITFLWFYLASIPDSLLMNIIIICMIYILEFYNLLYNKPLGILPNRQTIHKVI